MDVFSHISDQAVSLLIGIAVMIESGLIWLQSTMINEYRGIRTAALGNFLYGSGMFLATFRDSLPITISVIVSNYLVIIGTAVIYVAVSRFLGERIQYRLIALTVLPVLLLFPYYTLTNNDFAMRVHIIGGCSAILIAGISIQLFRLKNANFKVSAYFLASVSALYVFLLLLRSLLLANFQSSETLMLNSSFMTAQMIAMFLSNILWVMGFMLMVSQRLQAALSELATVDSLTRISNRRNMIAQLEAEFARFFRTNIQFSVLLVDVDHFKEVNDRYGHGTGDTILHDVAQLLKNSLRRQDYISRWGGEEFFILLPATNQHEAMEIGERLRTLVEGHEFRFDGHSAHLTISIGIGNSEVCRDANIIYKCSDEALYKAKVTRNAVALYS